MYRRLALVLPAVLLLTVASVQMALARYAGLSPWKGGGFGMFASVDGQPFRWLRIVVSAPDRSEELAVPAALADEAHRLITWPRERAVQAFARSLIAREQRHSRPVETIRIEVWRVDISPSLDASDVLMCQMTVAAGARAHDR
ncbi:MAG TPA: hypothetical protein VFJ02_23115 [Vicinamibacterales bacterium]|nr:hypothetical protein [Vicinamibacterales bacterium]